MTSDPIRLLEDPSAASALRNDLAHAAEAELQGLDTVAGLAALQEATATVTSSTTAVAGSSLLLKLGLGGSAAVAVVALWLGLGDRPQAEDDERAAGPVAAVAPAADAGPERPPRVGPEITEPVEREAEEPEVVAPEVVAPAREAEPEPKPASSRRKTSTSERPSATALSADDGVLREAKLVARARSNLARDPARALALAEEAERDFPQGQLVEERRAIAIRALVALGRIDEARRRAEPFLAEHGRGAHAAAVRRALEGAPAEP